MADFISLTGTEARVTASSTIDITKAVDVRPYDSFTARVFITYVLPTTSPSLTVTIWGGMQTDSLDGWAIIRPAVFSSLTTNGATQLIWSGDDDGFVPSYITWAATLSGITEVGFCITARANRRTSMLP